MNPLTTAFLLDWLNWSVGLTSTTPPTYHKHHGLCEASSHFYHNYHHRIIVLDDMQAAWVKQGLDLAYPFGATDFRIRYRNSTMHLCPKRRLWVMQTLGLIPSRRFGFYINHLYQISMWRAFGKPFFVRTWK